MRELARREPTFALHVHVGFNDPEAAIRVFNRMRVHIPMLLALSANSPFWQGRDSGLASSRTPLFQAFPRVGVPRRFESFQEWVDTVDMLVSCEAFPDPTFLWWDVRVQPRVGTIEVRIMDAQITLDATRALVAMVQSLARLEHEEAWAEEPSRSAPEVHDENRFLAARDGVDVALIDPVQRRRVPLRERLDVLLPRLLPHAQDLGCADALESVRELYETPGAGYQLRIARRAERLPGLVRQLSAEF
jgi:carboxylate-amine ligase